MNVGYQHDTANHMLNFVHPLDLTMCTQNVEGLWKHAKVRLRRMHGNPHAILLTFLLPPTDRQNLSETIKAFFRKK